MNVVKFQIDGKPIPWRRMRKNGSRHFPADGQDDAKKAIAFYCKSAMNKQGVVMAPKGVSVAMTVFAVFKLPQSLPKGDTRCMGSHHVSTPDADNLAKLVKDALNGVAYKDDCQVFELTVRKVWSDHERTHVTLEIFDDKSLIAKRNMLDNKCAKTTVGAAAFTSKTDLKPKEVNNGN